MKTNVVSNTFLFLSGTSDCLLKFPQLQQLLYVTNQEYLKKTGKPLLEENFFFQNSLPVLNSLAKVYKNKNNRHLTKLIRNSDGSAELIDLSLNNTATNIIKNVWYAFIYKQKTA